MYQRALAIRERALGPSHPDVGASLALLYRLQGQIQDALEASARTVDILQKRLMVGTARRSGSAVTELRSNRGYFVNYIGIAHEAVAKASELRASVAAEGYRVARLAQASETAQAVGGAAARFAAGGDALTAPVRERQDLASRWQLLDTDIVRAACRPPAERRPAEEGALRVSFDENQSTARRTRYPHRGGIPMPPRLMQLRWFGSAG